MSVWRRLRERFGRAEPDDVVPAAPAAPAAPPAPQPVAAPAPADELAPLVALGRGEAVDPALALSALARARGGPRERAALAAVTAAHAAGAASDDLRTLAAEIARDRGEAESALALVDGAASTAALIFAADLRADRGELSRALGLVERVLARDIDAPGARERHARWRALLGGLAPSTPSALDAPTLLRADAPDTPLRIVGEAGRGGAGTVYEAFDDALGRRVALKVYHRPEAERDKLAREARAAVELAGRGVIRVFDADLARGLIVMEWLPGGALKHWIGRADPAVLSPIERWLVPLADTLGRIHRAGVVHGDIKPANVVFRSPAEPVLTDFGLAHRIGEAQGGGSLGYMSPERLVGGSVDFGDDVYALGRLIDDALDALSRSDASEPTLRRWRALAGALTAPEADRPRDAADASDRIRGLAESAP